MIPIISIGDLITFIPALLITLYLWRVYIKRKGERLKYFLYFFISMSLAFLSISTPFLIFKSLPLITFSIILMPLFIYLGLAFLTILSLRILNWTRIEKIYLLIIIFSLVVSYLMLFINLDLVKIGTNKNLIYWFVPKEKIFWQIGSTINGIVFGVNLLLLAIFFFISGIKNKEGFIRKRAFLMGIGIFFLMLAGIINFVIGAAASLSANLVASLFAISGLLTLFGAIVKLKPETSGPSPFQTKGRGGAGNPNRLDIAERRDI